MEVQIQSTKIVKPIYDEDIPPPPSTVPLTIFDKVSYNSHMAVIYAYHPPTPPSATIELGLRMALSEYREWAGRLIQNDNGDHIIHVDDQGVRFIEATVDGSLDQLAMPLKPSPIILSFHPNIKDVEELVQVQLTRFSCGSLLVGFTGHHLIADGRSASSFLVAWGRACRGLDMGPLPFHNRNIFHPRDPPLFEFEHKGVEFQIKKLPNGNCPLINLDQNDHAPRDNIIVHKSHFTFDFLSKLKDKASSSNGPNSKPYSTFQALVAHLWRVITRARNLSAFETTSIRISVDGRPRMNPRVPNEYFGNLVLWAFPKARVKDLLQEPLSYAAKLIRDSVARVNDSYFKSFIDFATYKVKEEDLVTTAEMNVSAYYPNLEVDSWLRFPFYELDFGTGCPYLFMPSYFPTEGLMFLLPSFTGDGSVDAFVQLFQGSLASFKQKCYSIDY